MVILAALIIATLLAFTLCMYAALIVASDADDLGDELLRQEEEEEKKDDHDGC